MALINMGSSLTALNVVGTVRQKYMLMDPLWSLSVITVATNTWRNNMHSGYKPTNKWYSDFWCGITEIFGALWGSLTDFTDVSEWDWEFIGFIVGGIIILCTIGGIGVGLASILHYLGVF
jgi:hypothetical protein